MYSCTLAVISVVAFAVVLGLIYVVNAFRFPEWRPSLPGILIPVGVAAALALAIQFGTPKVIKIADCNHPSIPVACR
jgi:hypothetical protein